MGADVCIDAVGADASGNFLHTLFGRKLKLEGGSPIALHWAINSVKKGGVVSIVGVYGPTGNMIPIGNVVNKGITIRANQASVKRLLPRLIEHVKAGRLNPKAMITHRFPLEDVSEAYHMFSTKLDDCIKPVLIPQWRVRPMEPRARWARPDTSAIPGWGVDADPGNDPTYPMRDRIQDDSPGRNWLSPAAQTANVEVLTSIEHTQRPAVFGTPAPPSGVSGMVRRAAFTLSELRFSHWLLLMLADRINVVEGVLSDLGRGKIPDLVDEFGLKSRLKLDRPAAIRAGTTALLAGGLAISALLLARRNQTRFFWAGKAVQLLHRTDS